MERMEQNQRAIMILKKFGWDIIEHNNAGLICVIVVNNGEDKAGEAFSIFKGQNIAEKISRDLMDHLLHDYSKQVIYDTESLNKYVQLHAKLVAMCSDMCKEFEKEECYEKSKADDFDVRKRIFDNIRQKLQKSFVAARVTNINDLINKAKNNDDSEDKCDPECNDCEKVCVRFVDNCDYEEDEDEDNDDTMHINFDVYGCDGICDECEKCTVTVCVNEMVFDRCSDLFRALGFSVDDAINMFLTQCDRERGIPFRPHL